MAPPDFNSPNPISARLREQFDDRPIEDHGRGWDDLWKQNITPWDRNGPSLALRDAITSHPDLFGPAVQPSNSSSSTTPRRKRALVPGCGRGYDVLLLSSLGYDAYGLDISEHALAAARTLQTHAAETFPVLAPAPDSEGGGQARFLHADFFQPESVAAAVGAEGDAPSLSSSFDLVFDYTFLCALPPAMRPRWAARMKEAVAPGGALVCSEFPLGKPPRDGGPPHGLSSELYVELLRRPGGEVRYDEYGKVVVGSNGGNGEDGDGLVRVAHFVPERTHAPQQGKDYVSIWRHEGK